MDLKYSFGIEQYQDANYSMCIMGSVSTDAPIYNFPLFMVAMHNYKMINVFSKGMCNLYILFMRHQNDQMILYL